MTMLPRDKDSWTSFLTWTAIVVAALFCFVAFSCATMQTRRITYVDCNGLVCLGFTHRYGQAMIVSSDTLAGDCVCKDDKSIPEWVPCDGCGPR